MSRERIDSVLSLSENGVVTAKLFSSEGLHRGALKQLMGEGKIYRYSRGLYIKADAWEDDFYLLQQKYSKGIYSHDTALYLHGCSDRTPAAYTMSFPKGYNSVSLKNENITVKRAIPEIYDLGIEKVKSPAGNIIEVYSLERTLCDILRGSGSDIQIVNSAMKRYVSMKEKNIHRLFEYAEILRVKPKVLRYMEVLL